jgi:hypothetical protein
MDETASDPMMTEGKYAAPAADRPTGDPHQQLAAMDATLGRLRTRPTLATGTPPNDAAQLIARDLLNAAIVLAQFTGWTVQNIHTLVTATYTQAETPAPASGISQTSHASPA